MRRASVLASFVAVALLVTACGSRLPDEAFGPAQPVAVEQPPAPAVEEAPAQEPVEEPPREAQAAAQPPAADVAPESDDVNPETPVSPDEEEEDPRAIFFELSVEPTCAVIGDRMTATFLTEPRSELTMAVVYSDNQPHGQMGFADADDEGRYVWRWVVTPDVPPGDATVAGMSISQDGQRGGTETAPFTVAGVEGCP